MEAAVRANLFSYHPLNDPWAIAMRNSPCETLCASLPGLSRFTGDFEAVDRVHLRAADLRFAENYRVGGVVLVGDAFQTSCPATGTGVSRALTDVDRLCNVYVPRWLASPGMGASKIAQFYDDAEKQASDAYSNRLARYRRALTVDPGISWELRRRLIYPVRRSARLARAGVHWVSKAGTNVWRGAASR